MESSLVSPSLDSLRCFQGRKNEDDFSHLHHLPFPHLHTKLGTKEFLRKHEEFQTPLLQIIITSSIITSLYFIFTVAGKKL